MARNAKPDSSGMSSLRRFYREHAMLVMVSGGVALGIFFAAASRAPEVGPEMPLPPAQSHVPLTRGGGSPLGDDAVSGAYLSK